MDIREVQSYAQEAGLHLVTFEDEGQTLTVLGRIKGTLPEEAGARFYDSPAQGGEGVWFEPLVPTLIGAHRIVKIEQVRV